jgi:hypothetical protein
MIKKNKQYLNRTPTQYSDVEKKNIKLARSVNQVNQPNL